MSPGGTSTLPWPVFYSTCCPRELYLFLRVTGGRWFEYASAQYAVQWVGGLVGWSVGGLVGWSVGGLVGWSVGRLVGWLIGRLVGWSVGWLVAWLAGWLAGWLSGWLTG